jgi:hypothetical protein
MGVPVFESAIIGVDAFAGADIFGGTSMEGCRLLGGAHATDRFDRSSILQANQGETTDGGRQTGYGAEEGS